MDTRYQPIYKQAAALQHQYHDITLHAAHSPQATVLRNEIHNLTNDIALNRHPRTIEHRVRTIENQLRMAEHYHSSLNPGIVPPAALNTHQAAGMYHNFESIRKQIRMNPHY